MAFPYKKVLILGATSGIGLAFAERLVQRGIFVIVTGRRKENLNNFVQKHGSDKAAAVPVDLTKLDALPGFAQTVKESHPDLDCVIFNSGIQRRSVFSEAEAINMDVIIQEMTVNYLSYLSLTKEFVPFFRPKENPTAFIYVTSGLALAPLLRCSNYCATKAALHHWILCVREHLKKFNIKVIEILPPAVQTELHDAKNQPDIVDGKNIGMPLEEFTNEAMDGLLRGDEQIPVGQSKPSFDTWEQQRQQVFHEWNKAIGLP
ncbi:hypothetical protein VTN31DRAFT_3109 [Thermomyces dupontii]|uniref:uncharacterized protein n=1 Tax=Talaromyces thermophilus TaxID=28565 RepID=UPI003742B4BD